MDVNSDGEHDFIIPPDGDALLIVEGIWEEFIESRECKAQQKANQISYIWDGLIEQFQHSHTGRHTVLYIPGRCRVFRARHSFSCTRTAYTEEDF